jgi:serine/threonine protein kinase
VSSREHLRRFQFIREIASGGFGSVYLSKVMHVDGFSRLVAVKLLKAQWSDSDEVACRMRDEARLLGLLRHRNIVDVIDLTSIDGRAAVVMEYLEAVDLRSVVLDLDARGKKLPLRSALEIAASAASALDAAYNRPPIPGDKPLRVIHRDIKPSNIMVDDTGMVKVLDFGVAQSEIENRESHTQELQFGSVDYMAPERLFFEPETPASDVYSLAATLFEILALEKFGKSRGRPARHAAYIVDRLSFLRAQLGIGGTVATELEQLIGGGLAFNHEDRPTASEFYQRARTLARTVDSLDLSTWSEQAIPRMLQAVTTVHDGDRGLAGQTLQEDPRVFATHDRVPDSQSAGPADILRQGALAEMEDTGAFVPSPQTGAPAQLHARQDEGATPEADWDGGATVLGGLKGPVRVPRPGNAEEARMMKTGPRPQSPESADPGDPFAQLVRSPLSPPKTPTAKPLSEEDVSEDGETEVADTLRSPVVPVRGGAAGDYDPSAPEASEPIAPLPAPPGVVSRPLEPELPESGPLDSPETEETEYEAMPAETPVVSPPPSAASEAPVSVGAEPAATDDDSGATSLFTVDGPSQDEPLRPVQLKPAAAEASVADHEAAAEEEDPPSRDEVVPRSTESRYGPEADAASRQPVPVIPEYETTLDAFDPPDVPMQSGAGALGTAPGDGAELDPGEDSLVPTVPFESTGPQIAEEFLAPTEHIAGRRETMSEVATGPVTTSESFAPTVDDAPISELDVRPSAHDDDTDDLVEAPARTATRQLPLLAAMGCFGVILLGGAASGAVWHFGLLDGVLASASTEGTTEGTTESTTESTTAAQAPADVEAAADTGSVGATAQDGLPEGAMLVAPGVTDIRKLTVSCTGGFKEKGTDPIVVPAETAGPCKVELILNSRRRLRTSIEVHTPGRLVCFADGSDGCTSE